MTKTLKITLFLSIYHLVKVDQKAVILIIFNCSLKINSISFCKQKLRQ